ncbi:MAG: YihY/virulence factor BrkB family protein [Deltaproteobacteria bacterium]|nr:YihY/virulence factor BrkB family protein [Deltaproteobacteria bacterium]
MSLPGLRGVSFKAFAKGLWQSVSEAALPDSAAGLTYYLLFALFPFLTCLVTLGAYLPLGHPEDQLVGRLQGVVPPAALKIIHDQLYSLLHRTRPQLFTFGLALAIYTASRAANAFRKALNLAYDVQESRPWWRTELASLLFTVLAVVLLLVATAMLAAGSNLGLWVAGKLHIDREFQVVWSWLRWPSTALLVMLLTAFAYRTLPDVQQRFRFVTPGTVLSTVLWLVAAWGFTFWVSHFGSFDITYGSLGAVIILLTLLYLSAYVFLLGGHVNAVIEHLSAEGKAPGARRFGERAPPLQDRPSAAPPGALDVAAVATRARARLEAERAAQRLH